MDLVESSVQRSGGVKAEVPAGSQKQRAEEKEEKTGGVLSGKDIEQ